MSLRTVTINFLGLKPNVLVSDKCIQAKSGFLQKLFYLFSCNRRVTFHREKKMIEAHKKTWWLKKRSDFITYESVAEVNFEFGGWNDFGWDFWQDHYEKIWIVLVVKDTGNEFPIICFEGEGSKETGFMGVLLGDAIFDFRGNQGKKASEFYTIVKDELNLWHV